MLPCHAPAFEQRGYGGASCLQVVGLSLLLQHLRSPVRLQVACTILSTHTPTPAVLLEYLLQTCWLGSCRHGCGVHRAIRFTAAAPPAPQAVVYDAEPNWEPVLATVLAVASDAAGCAVQLTAAVSGEHRAADGRAADGRTTLDGEGELAGCDSGW